MTAASANLLNAIVLIAVSILAFVVSGGASYTALVPAAFGAALLACAPGVRRENKLIAHIAVALTLIVLVALVTPLLGAIGRGDAFAVFRVGLMMATSALALVFFIKSFIDARRARG